MEKKHTHISIKKILIISSFILSSCSHNVEIVRYSEDHVSFQSWRPYTAVLAPNGAVVVSTVKSQDNVLESILNGLMTTASDVSSNIDWKVGRQNEGDKTEISVYK